jgi:hypothetical protein
MAVAFAMDAAVRPAAPHPLPLVVEDLGAGPQGPVSPIIQKLLFSPIRTIRSAGTPIPPFQIRKASSSSVKIVIQSRSLGIPMTTVRYSHAQAIVSS